MKMDKHLLGLMLLACLLWFGCNVAEPSKSPDSITVKEDTTVSANTDFQEFLKYFEPTGLPAEVFHHSYVNTDPIPKRWCMKFLGFRGEKDAHAYGNIAVVKDYITLVAAFEPFENVVYYTLYIFDQAGNRITDLQIAGKDDSWLGTCVFADNGDIRLETRTPDMDVDESEPLSIRWIRIGDKGKIEELDSE